MTFHPVFLEMGFSAENLANAGSMLLRGMGTVFFVLVILWGIIALFGAVSSAAAKKAPKAAPAPAAVSADPAPAADDGALVAAITAAIEAYRASEGLAATPYRVVSFKKRENKNRRNSDD